MTGDVGHFRPAFSVKIVPALTKGTAVPVVPSVCCDMLIRKATASAHDFP